VFYTGLNLLKPTKFLPLVTRCRAGVLGRVGFEKCARMKISLGTPPHRRADVKCTDMEDTIAISLYGVR
jgi:hypothetical protein